jgi:hypothetical protein
MTDLAAALSTLRRPRLLIRAARFGQRDYDRTRDLRRLLRSETPPGPDQALDRLMSEEAQIDDIRRARAADYSVSRHVALLIAIMAEARTYLQRDGRPATDPGLR